MRIQKRVLFLGFLLLLAVGAAVTMFRRADRIERELQSVERAAEGAGTRLGALELLASADSLLHARRYEAARAAYRDLAGTPAAASLGGVLDARIEHVGRVLRMTRALDTLQVLSAQDREAAPDALARVPAEPVAPLTLEATNPNQFDSLSFALQKAQMRIRNLEGRLQRRSGGNYLTFKSRQGNDVNYVGDVRDGKAHGRGVAILSSGSRYEGSWRDNLKHGSGEFHWPDGAYYEGAYVNDEREGQGTYHFPDGTVYVGGWKDDVRHGRGVFYDEEGEVVAEGVWRNDELAERE